MKNWKYWIAAVMLGYGIITISAYAAQTQEIIKTVDLIQTYDENSGQFFQTIEEGFSFSSTIPQDLITSGGVRFDQFADEILYILEKDGTTVDYESGQVITESGDYHLQLLIMPQINLSGMEEPSMEQLQNDAFALENLQILNRDYTIAADFYFTIIEHAVSNRNYIKAPEGYQIRQISFDGTPVRISDKRWCRIKEDGVYTIQFHPLKPLMPEYELSFLKDTQPPLLQFEGMDESGTAKKSLSYTCNEENCVIEVYRDGRQVEETYGEIHTPGLYRLVVRDPAGNATSYLVQVKDHYPFFLLFLFLGGTVAAAGGAYLIFRRQKLTVR